MQRYGALTGRGLLSRVCLGVSLTLLAGAAFGQAPHPVDRENGTPAVAGTGLPSMAAQAREPGCDVSAGVEVLIRCDYNQAPVATDRDPRLVLRHATISFQTDEENYMRAEFTFENPGKAALPALYPVYLSIDDESGNNYFRRRLPSVDLSKVTPGKQLTFSDHVVVPALRPGRYLVQLWILRPGLSPQFDPAHSFLLSSRGVADPESGLNKLATMTIVQ
jgi:hypothetical protein